MRNDDSLFTLPEWERCRRSFLDNLYARSQSVKSLEAYRLHMRQFFGANPHTPPDRYSRADVERYLSRPCTSRGNPGGPPAVATRNLRLSVLASFYTFASTYQVYGRDGLPHPLLMTPAPTAGIRRGKAALRPRALTRAELTRFFAAIPADTVMGLRDRALFLMYFWTARRRAEIARLTWGDLEQGIIVEPSGIRRPGWLYSFIGKGAGGVRDKAELPQPVKDAIDRYLVASGRLSALTATSPLFATIGPAHGGKPYATDMPMRPGSIGRRFTFYARAVGLSASLHALRHTSAHERHAAGEDILSIQRLLRHASLQTTFVYLHSLAGTADTGAALLMTRFATL